MLALWGLLWFSRVKHMHHIHIYGDSKALINGMLERTNFGPTHLKSWMEHIMLLRQEFSLSPLNIFFGRIIVRQATSLNSDYKPQLVISTFVLQKTAWCGKKTIWSSIKVWVNFVWSCLFSIGTFLKHTMLYCLCWEYFVLKEEYIFTFRYCLYSHEAFYYWSFLVYMWATY